MAYSSRHTKQYKKKAFRRFWVEEPRYSENIYIMTRVHPYRGTPPYALSHRCRQHFRFVCRQHGVVFHSRRRDEVIPLYRRPHARPRGIFELGRHHLSDPSSQGITISRSHKEAKGVEVSTKGLRINDSMPNDVIVKGDSCWGTKSIPGRVCLLSRSSLSRMRAMG